MPITYDQLSQVGIDTGQLVPTYAIKKLRPEAALESLVGNCFATVTVACGLLVLRHQVEPTVAYPERNHATPKAGMLSSRQLNYAHIDALVETDTGGDETKVLGLGFGIDGTTGVRVQSNGKGDITDYNERDAYAKVDPNTGEIRPTELAVESGLYFADWRTGVNQYLEALGEDPIDLEQFLLDVEAADARRAAAQGD